MKEVKAETAIDFKMGKQSLKSRTDDPVKQTKCNQRFSLCSTQECATLIKATMACQGWRVQ